MVIPENAAHDVSLAAWSPGCRAGSGSAGDAAAPQPAANVALTGLMARAADAPGFTSWNSAGPDGLTPSWPAAQSAARL
ncbi:hypothetical protein G6F58_013301 [Rhizopus delemar]|nr:hypothetical protein G6F58_013301 [Rhizopus delemar]